MTTAFLENGDIEEVPDVDDDTLAHWRRYKLERAGGEEGEEGQGEEEEEGEEGGVSVEAEAGAGAGDGKMEGEEKWEVKGDVEMDEEHFAPPEPVSADEDDSE